MIVYYCFFIYLTLLAVLNINKGKVLFILITGYLVLFAGTKELGVDRDSFNYLQMYELFQEYFDALKFGIEPGISIIGVLLRKIGFNEVYDLFFVFALIGVSLKIQAIIKYSPIPLLSIFLYYCFMFFKQDFTQIRAAVATGVFLWSIDDILDKRFIKYALKILLASCFHSSAIVYLPIYFINTNSINKGLYLKCMLGAFILANLKITSILLQLPIISYFGRLQSYADKVSIGASGSDVFNPLGLLFIFQLILGFSMLYFVDIIARKDRYGILFVKLIVIGNIYLYLLGSIAATVATRICELFYVTLFISGVYFIYFIRPLWCGIIFTILVGCVYWAFQMLYDPIMMPYHSWL